MLFPGALQTRQTFAHALMNPAAVYAPASSGLSVRSISLAYRDAASPRALLLAMADPTAGILPAGLTDADILGLALQDGTLLVNLSDRYGDVIRHSGMDQRLIAYSIVNTLCQRLNVRRVRFFFSGRAVDSLGDSLVWSGEFLYNPGLITD